MAGTSRDAARARTAQRILDAAREEFAAHGYKGATVRAIAEKAGVHPSLVMQHHGTKERLFASAARLPADDEQAAAEHVSDVLGARLDDLPPQTRALMRSMLTSPEAERAMRDHLDRRVLNLSASLEGDDAETRALLAVCGILGLTVARHFLKLEAFERISDDDLAAAASARFLTGKAGD
ncbi:TetR/AcrR family transcriptional regulator [Kineosporia succinea]|uniref:AcrR family transcriptional regulator n=1 Tax=Kineosporia succinea TaxID=84632 RepID=A0ABT9P9V9_9ACTN|nr:TetR/AcrR family transcriptional regulator [Kineosporia succinea]MDP9829482.1 AcrR family transcriptional regulator [Kineosporia succinea]